MGRPQDCTPNVYMGGLRHFPVVVTSDPEQAYQKMVRDCQALGKRPDAWATQPRLVTSAQVGVRLHVAEGHQDVCSPTDYRPAGEPRVTGVGSAP